MTAQSLWPLPVFVAAKRFSTKAIHVGSEPDALNSTGHKSRRRSRLAGLPAILLSREKPNTASGSLHDTPSRASAERPALLIHHAEQVTVWVRERDKVFSLLGPLEGGSEAEEPVHFPLRVG